MTCRNRIAMPEAQGKSGTPEFAEMSAARRAFQRAWLDWLRSNPSPTDISLEMRGTCSAIRQLAEMPQA